MPRGRRARNTNAGCHPSQARRAGRRARICLSRLVCLAFHLTNQVTRLRPAQNWKELRMRKLIVLGVVGLVAQLIDGSLGMAYGVTSSTLLLAVGVAPAAASAAVHFSEIGTTLVSGFSHHKLGNVDWRTVSIIAVPGGIGAFFGATFLSSLPGDVAKPWVAALLLGLGIYVIWRFLVLGGRRPQFSGRLSKRFLAPLGLFAGAMDA